MIKKFGDLEIGEFFLPREEGKETELCRKIPVDPVSPGCGQNMKTGLHHPINKDEPVQVVEFDNFVLLQSTLSSRKYASLQPEEIKILSDFLRFLKSTTPLIGNLENFISLFKI